MRWLSRLVDTFRISRLDRDLDEEVRFHLEMRAREYGNEGLSTEEARSRALRRFGSPLRAVERTREVHVLSWLDGVRQDLLFGVRLVRRAPLLAGAAILSLAIGIGATAGVFTVLDAAVLRSLPVREPDGLSVLQWSSAEWPKVRVQGYVNEDDAGANRSGSFSYETFRQLASRARPYAQVTAFQQLPRATTMTRGVASTTIGAVVTGGFLNTVGVRPQLGRLLAETDDMTGAAPVVVISDRFWQRAYGGDPGVVGDVLGINGHPFTVVGVAERPFFGVRPGVWLDFYTPVTTGYRADPAMAARAESPLLDARNWWLQVIARRKAGIDAVRLQRQLEPAFAGSLDPSVTAGLQKQPVLLVSPGARGYGFLDADDATPVVILMGLASLVLLIACANVGNLLLARASARRQEAAMRMALGASRSRLVQQQLTESLLLAAGGGVLGLALGQWFTAGLASLLRAGDVGLLLDVHLGWRTLAFSAAVTVAAGLMFGLVPALSLARAPLQVAPRSAGYVRPGWRRRLGFGKPLVAFQIAVSLVILVVAGLFVRSLSNLYRVPLGFNAAGLVLFEVDPTRSGFTDGKRLNLLAGIRDTVVRLPAVTSAAWSEFALVGGSMSASGVWVGGQRLLPGKYCRLLSVGPTFHETMQIPVVLGRTIDDRDGVSAPRVAVVNQAFVRTYVPDGPPLGYQFTLDESGAEQIQIVGVVGDAKYDQLRTASPVPVAYLADAQQASSGGRVFSVRTSGSTATAASAVRLALGRAYPTLPLIDVRSFDDQLSAHLASERMLSTLSTTFGLFALILAAVGLYGVVAFAVARRTPEMGIRLTLGATPAAVMRLVLRDSALVVLPGAALGLGSALVATRLLRAQLFGLTPGDPATAGAAVGLIILVAAAATIVPARRAARVDPTEALRAE